MCVQDVCTFRRCFMTTTKVFQNGNSQALARDMTVITHNSDEFKGVPGIKTEDWVI